MYQINCRILDGKNDRIDDCGTTYTRIISTEHSTEIVNADNANKMDAVTDDEHAHAHAQKHISVTTVTIAPRRASPSPTGHPYGPLGGLGAPPLLQLDRPGDSELDVVQCARSTIVIPPRGKATPVQVSGNLSPVCRQTVRCLEDVDRDARPVFLEKLKSLSVEEGQVTRFTCQVRGQPMPSVQWEKDGRQVAGEKFKLTSSSDTFTLEIAETTFDDAGRYVCVAKNEVGEARSMASLMVQKGQGHGSKVGQIDFKSALQNRTQLKTYNLQSMDHVHRTDFRSVLKKQPSDVRTKPTATCRQLDYSGEEGATVSMSCEVAGIPEPKIAWFKDMQLVEPSESVSITCLTGVSTLQLNHVESGSAGTYTCQAENELGKSSATCRLSVRETSLGVEITEQHTVQNSTCVNNILTNNDIIQDDGKNSPTETTENRLPSSNDNEEETNHSPRVTIRSNESEDNGKGDEEKSSPGDGANPVTLLASPKNSSPQTKNSQTSAENRSTNSQPEIPETGKTDSSTAQMGSVTIDDEDDDAFEPVSNDALSSSVDEPPFIEDLQPENIHICCGSEIHLVARFSGHPLPQTKWLKGAELLEQDDRIRFEMKPRFAELMILNAQPQDTGTYTIVITNEFGEDKQLSSVTIEDKPDPPVGRPAVTSILDNSVVLSWSGSSYDGGCSVVRYRIEMSHHEKNNWEVLTDDCQHTTYQVNNLVANTEYVFRVSAANKHGFSQPGDISDSIVTNGLKVSSAAAAAAATATDDFPFAPRIVTIDKDKKFADSYVLGEEIGKGKFGSVYKCSEKTTDRLFAAKFIRVKAGQREEFRKEIEIMNELHHPKLLLLWDSFESAKEIILVMEHVSGGELMERIINDDYVLTERECIHFMRQICDGVQYMHSSDILHLDLKPENILCITPNSNEIKIIDFGLARKFDPSKEFKILFGTAEFVAPEVINYDAISYKTDMWSLGVVCYVLLSGLSPFLGNNDKETLVNVTKAQFDFDDEAFDEISDDAKDFISMLLVKDQRKRMWVEDSLRHRWMAQDVTYMRAKKLSTVKHKKFMARNKWQKTGNALVALRRMVGLQRMSSGLMDPCRSPLSSSSLADTPSLHSDELSTISESDDSGFRSAQTNASDQKSILGLSKDTDGVADLNIGEIGGQCESKKDEFVANGEGKLSQEDKNEGSVLSEDKNEGSGLSEDKNEGSGLLEDKNGVSGLSEDKNKGSGLSEDCAAVRKSSSLECSDKLELSEVTKSLDVEKSDVGGKSEFSVETISLEAEKSEIIDQSESELSCGTNCQNPSEGEKSEASIETSEVLSGGMSEIQGNGEALTISSPSFESTPPSDPASCSLEENVKDNIKDKSLSKSSDQKASIATKNNDPSKTARKTSDQPSSDLTKKRELFTRKPNDVSPATRNTESSFKKSLDQQTVSRFSDKSKVARTCSEQPSQSLPSSRNTASGTTQGKQWNKPGDLKTPPKPSETASTTRKSPASSVTKNSDSLVATRKFAVQQMSTQKTTKPKKAPTFVRKMKNLQVLEGATARFEVLVDGNPTPTISWFKDGKEIPLALEKYRTELSDEGRCSLTVMTCGEDDDAEYGCKAINLLGSIVTKANLYVEPIGEELDNNSGAGRNQIK